MAQQVKDLVMLLQQLRPLLQLGFGPWTGDFCMPWKWQKTKNQNKKKKRRGREQLLRKDVGTVHPSKASLSKT